MFPKTNHAIEPPAPSGMRFAFANLLQPERLPSLDELQAADVLVMQAQGLPADDPAVTELTVESLAGLAPGLYVAPRLRVLAGVDVVMERPGGLSALACQAGKRLARGGSPNLPVAVIDGSDVLGRLEEMFRGGAPLLHAETGEPLATLQKPLVAATATLGPEPFAAALGAGARVVVGGRVASEALIAASFTDPQGVDAAAAGAAMDQLATSPIAATTGASDSGAVNSGVLPDGDTAVTGWYVDRYTISAVAQPTAASMAGGEHSGWAESAERALASLAPASRPPTVVELTSAGPPTAAALMIVVEAPDAASAEPLRRRVASELNQIAGPLEFHPAFPPTARRRLGRWPSSAPVASIEWSIGLRSAAEWAELSRGDD